MTTSEFTLNIVTIENQIYLKMLDYYTGDPKRIQHFTKVHSYAKLIGSLEGLSDYDLSVLRITALMHDIGIKPAEEKYNSTAGPYQEELGQAPARAIMEDLDLPKEVCDRVCYLIGHHHTYTNIDGADYQILVESDFIVNLYEDCAERDTIMTAKSRIFKTQNGISVLEKMFNL